MHSSLPKVSPSIAAHLATGLSQNAFHLAVTSGHFPPRPLCQSYPLPHMHQHSSTLSADRGKVSNPPSFGGPPWPKGGTVLGGGVAFYSGSGPWHAS